MSKVSCKTVVSRCDEFVPAFVDSEGPTCKVEYTEVEGIPALHFSWKPVHHLWTSSAKEAQEMAEAGFPMACLVDPSNKSVRHWSGWAQQKKTEHRWFMNFRRYGWCFSNCRDSGYAWGHVYANGNVLGGGADSNAEHIVRDAFIVSRHQLLQDMGCPYFTGSDLDRAFAKLLAEGVEYAKGGNSPHVRAFSKVHDGVSVDYPK